MQQNESIRHQSITSKTSEMWEGMLGQFSEKKVSKP